MVSAELEEDWSSIDSSDDDKMGTMALGAITYLYLWTPPIFRKSAAPESEANGTQHLEALPQRTVPAALPLPLLVPLPCLPPA